MESVDKGREDVIPFETICGNHNHVIWMLKQYKKSGDSWYIDQSIKLVRYCRRQGGRMEARLMKLRNAIESCGFKRVYKVKKEKRKSWQENE